MKIIIVILYIMLMVLMVRDMSAEYKTFNPVLFEEVWFSKLARRFGFVVVHEDQWKLMYEEHLRAVEIVRGYELKNSIMGLSINAVEGDNAFVDFSTGTEAK